VGTLRVRVCLLVIGSFLLGGFIGALLFDHLRERSLLIPAVLTGLCGTLYSLYRQRTTTP
jgi:uncharacterized membrane protein YfcA